MKNININISYKSILLVFGVAMFLYLAYLLRGVILLLFVAYIVNAGLRPFVNFFVSKKLPRNFSIFLTYLIFFILFILLSLIIVLTGINQLRDFLSDIDIKVINLINFIEINLPFLKEYIGINSLDNIKSVADLSLTSLQGLDLNSLLNLIFQAFNFIGLNSISFISSGIGLIFSFFIVIILSAYMVGNKNHVYEPLTNLLPQKYILRVNPVMERIENSLGAWFRGQLILMGFIGVLTYLILTIPSLFIPDFPLTEYALVIAIVAALLESIPNIGPLITLIIGVLVAVLSGGGIPLIIYVIVSFGLLQQLEGLLIVPYIFKKAIDLHPILSIFAAIAGLELAGPIGALIAIPIAALIQIIVLEVSKSIKG